MLLGLGCDLLIGVRAALTVRILLVLLLIVLSSTGLGVMVRRLATGSHRRGR